MKEYGRNDALPPHNIDAEEAVIGSLLIDGSSIPLVRDSLSPDDFYSEHARGVYAACLALDRRGVAINEITVAEEMARMGLETGAAYLSEVISQCPSSLDIEHYSLIVAELSAMRQLIKAVEQIREMGYTADSDVISSLAQAKGLIEDINFTASQVHVISPKQAAENMLSFITDMQEDKVSMSWGFVDLDSVSTGIYPGDYIIVGARPSVGKTQFLLEVAHNLVRQQKTGLFVSLEMGLRAIQEREIAMECGISIYEMRRRSITEDKWGQIAHLAGEVSERPLYYLTHDRTSSDVAVEARQMKEKTGLDFVILDYVQLLKDCRGLLSNRLSTHHLISNASKTLKAVARDLDIPVIVASQLNRLVEYRGEGNQRPRLSDLNESGCLEEDADVVLLLYRDEVVNPQSKEPGVLEIKMAKNRQLGQAPVVKLQWVADRHSYGNINK